MGCKRIQTGEAARLTHPSRAQPRQFEEILEDPQMGRAEVKINADEISRDQMAKTLLPYCSKTLWEERKQRQ